MSETVGLPPLPAGMTITTRTEDVNNVPEERTVVTFGSPPRTIEVVDLDMGAQFDLAEVTGTISGDNLEYRNLAFIAASVRTIDGVPAGPTDISRKSLRTTLRRLGADGVRAAGAVITRFAQGAAGPTEADHRAAVGN